ncbi:hypothetical protein DITRI_Ditri20bG0135100 [Diplodiscus trichospermus]
MDVLELSKTGKSLRSWILIDASGNSQPTAILGKDKAIVANLDKIRCIITADQVLLLNSLDANVLQYVMELQKRLKPTSNGVSSYSPFEFRALAVALEVVSGSLESEASELELEAYPLLDELTSHVSTLNLERIRRLKSRLVALTQRIRKNEIEKTMDDNEEMSVMYLTENKRKIVETSSNTSNDEFLMGSKSDGGPFEASDPMTFSPVSSPSESCRLKQYIDDTENFINSQLVSDE